MQRAIDETLRRRKIQEDYNSKHGITPESIIKKIAESRLAGKKEQLATIDKVNIDPGKLSKDEMKLFIDELNEQMELASLNLEFELAAEIRDKITELKQLQKMKNVK